ncbi:MAG: hypothetical protein WD016_12550 [Balneolaceae bacterium]
MDTAKWIDLVLSISTGICFFLLIRQYIKYRSLLELYFALAAFILGLPYLFDLFNFNLNTQANYFEWYKLISITIYISGLLVLIRESKPVFARFPLYLTALPFISFLFFPFITDSIVINNLINAIYQGGALIVTALIFTINHARNSGRRYYLIGIGFVLISYLSYWFYFNKVNYEYIWIAELLFAAGIVITTLKFITQESNITANA